MSEEKELQEAGVESSTGLDELADFVDFADLDALDTASNLEVFGDLGDLADLGDVPDLSKPLNAADGSSVGEDISEELPISELAEEPMPIPGMEEEVPMPIPDMAEEEPVPVPDMAEEEPMPIPELAEEEPMSVPELAEEPMPVPDIAEEVPMLDSELAEDAPLPDMDEEVVIRSVDPEPNAPDIFSDDSEESLFTSFGDTDDAELSEDTAPDAAVQDEQPLPDLSEGELPDIGGNLDEMPDIPVGDAAELLGGMDLDLQLGDESEEEIPLAMEDNGDSGDSGLDSMLGGILGNLDLNGSMEAEDGSDPMANILGLGSNPFGEDVESLPDEGDMQDLLDVAEMMPEDSGDAAEQAEEKKPGFLKKVFGNVVTDEIAEQERLAAQKEEEEAAKKVEEDAKAKEEAEAKKAEKKAAKEAAKEEKKKEKEAKKAEKAAAKAEKKAKKKEEEEAAELEVVGKLNKVGVSIIVIATILFLVFEIGGTNLFSYSSAKKEALNYFDMGKYTEAYQKAIGTDMRNKDEESYNKIKVVMKVQQSLNAYQNYDRIQYYPEALDALLRGLKRYDANIDEAMELEVDTDMMSCRKQILTLLQEEFNLSEAEAYAIIAMDKEAYQSKVIDLGVKKKNN